MDRQNIKKIVLLFKYHGYPTGFCYGCNVKSRDQNNFTPNIIVTHNLVRAVSEFIFPILQKIYSDKSFHFPQEIYFDKEKNVLKYVLLDEVIKNEILLENITIFN